MRVSFFVLATGEVELLRRSLPAAAAERPDELVLVDNGADDAVAELGREHATRVVRLERRATYCEAMNAGLAECQGDAVALLQADTFVTPGYREAAVRALEADPGVGAVAPRLVRAHPDGSPTGELDTAGMVVDRRRKNGLVGHATPAAAWSRRGEVFGADGAAAVYRREALRDGARGDEVFDPDLERWAADADVAWRSRVLGWRAAYEPEAVVHHIRTYSPSTRAAMSAESRRMQFRNRYLMLVKNDSWRELRRDLHRVALYEALALGHAVLRERDLLPAYAEAWRRMPGARARRAHVQSRRRVERVPFGLRAAPVPDQLGAAGPSQPAARS